jgi:hypothetical protein
MTYKDIHYKLAGLHFNHIVYDELPQVSQHVVFSGSSVINSVQLQLGSSLNTGSLVVAVSGAGLQVINLNNLNIYDSVNTPDLEDPTVKDFI